MIHGACRRRCVRSTLRRRRGLAPRTGGASDQKDEVPAGLTRTRKPPAGAGQTTFSHDGLVFDVRTDGPAEGTPVVLLHGFPETSKSWREVTPHLAGAGYRVFAPDQRGYSPGARPRSRRAYRARELVADVIALADQHGLERFHVVGHDWGAAAAWGVAIGHPARVLTLSALSVPHPAAFSRALLTSRQALRSWYMAAFQLPWLPERLLGAGDGARLHRSLVRSGLPESYADEYVQHMREPGALSGGLNWYRGMSLRDGRPAPVTVPTMLVWSTRDPFIDEASVRLTQRFVSARYRLEILEGVSHWIPEEAPDRVAELLLRHLSVG